MKPSVGSVDTEPTSTGSLVTYGVTGGVSRGTDRTSVGAVPTGRTQSMTMRIRKPKKAGTVYFQPKTPPPTERCMLCGALAHLHLAPCWKKTTTTSGKGSSND